MGTAGAERFRIAHACHLKSHQGVGEDFPIERVPIRKLPIGTARFPRRKCASFRKCLGNQGFVQSRTEGPRAPPERAAMLEAWRFRRKLRRLYVAQGNPQPDDKIAKKCHFWTGTRRGDPSHQPSPFDFGQWFEDSFFGRSLWADRSSFCCSFSRPPYSAH